MAGVVNLHRLAGAQDRRRLAALDGPCRFCPKQSVALIESWDGFPNGLCERHADQGARLGFQVWRREDYLGSAS